MGRVSYQGKTLLHSSPGNGSLDLHLVLAEDEDFLGRDFDIYLLVVEEASADLVGS